MATTALSFTNQQLKDVWSLQVGDKTYAATAGSTSEYTYYEYRNGRLDKSQPHFAIAFDRSGAMCNMHMAFPTGVKHADKFINVYLDAALSKGKTHTLRLARSQEKQVVATRSQVEKALSVHRVKLDNFVAALDKVGRGATPKPNWKVKPQSQETTTTTTTTATAKQAIGTST